VRRASELGEGHRELGLALGQPDLGHHVAAGRRLQVPVEHELVEVADADRGVHAEEAFEQGGVDDLAEPLAAQPVHDLQDLAAPVEGPKGGRLRRAELVH
jgi:hypothetical protein